MTGVLARSLRRHWLLSLLVLGGVVLRVLVQLAYQPALLYIDSFRYLEDVGVFYPGGINPVGYEFLLLGPLLLVGDLGFVVAVQHLLGIALAVAIYVLLQRLHVRRWVAALAAAPVLLDGYQLQIEHNIMSDLLFQIVLLVVVALLTWWGTPGPRLAAVAGAVLAASVLVRVVGLTLVVPAAAFVVLAAGLRPRDGWKRRLVSGAALAGGFSAVLFCYAMYSLICIGVPGLTGNPGSATFGRAAVVADCASLDLTPQERLVCPKDPVPVRKAKGIDYYIHFFYQEVDQSVLPVNTPQYTAVEQSFARKVLVHQPGDIVGGVAEDFFKNFEPTRTQSLGDVPLDRWQFQTFYPMFTPPWYTAEWLEIYADGSFYVDPALSGFLRAYQLSIGYTPGTALGAALLLAFAACLGAGRARGTGLRSVCLLPAGLATTVLLTASAMEFSWRYQLPALVLAPIAGALGITALAGRRPPDRHDPDESTAADRWVTATAHQGPPVLADETSTSKEIEMSPTIPGEVGPDVAGLDEVDRAALADYTERYGEQRFAPVVVLIAAYNEEEAIGGVLDGIPGMSCGLEVDTLVVVDGASDRTAEVALRHGAHVCVASTNRGQGAALRLGYRLAAERGARYVITTDADGQYDIAELPKLLRPLIDDEADFVTGSRRLGRSETTDQLRRAGTYVFAWLVSALTSQNVSDTSFGFRGMKVDVPNTVRLEQLQYQSSELLVGVLAHGYRVLEQPMTMLERTAGHSKKGNNVLYGYRYARVVLGTWLRERRARNVPAAREKLSEPAPAVGER
jgi:hypothetical protein